MVGALQCRHVVVVAAEHVGRRGQPLEILWLGGSAAESASKHSVHARRAYEARPRSRDRTTSPIVSRDGPQRVRMTERVIVRRGAYHDSVTLMLVSREAAAEEGAETVLGRDGDAAERRPDRRPGLRAARRCGAERPRDRDPRGRRGGRAGRASSVRCPGARAAAAMRSDPRRARSCRRCAGRPELNLAFLSVPGRHVGYEAAAARRGRAARVLLLRRARVRAGGALEAPRARARAAVHGRRLRHGDPRRRRARLRQRRAARAGRHRRRVGDRHPGGLLPARRGGHRDLARDRRRRARPERRGRRHDVPARRRAARGRRRDRGDRRDLQAAGPGRGGRRSPRRRARAASRW